MRTFELGALIVPPLCAAAALLHLASRLGWRSAVSIFAAAITIALAAVVAGAAAGVPYGARGTAGPWALFAAWGFMLYASLAICGRILSAGGEVRTRWRWAVVAALVLTAWDVLADPTRAAGGHWLAALLGGLLAARVMLAIASPDAWAARVSPSRLALVLYAANGSVAVLGWAGRGRWWSVLLGTALTVVPLVLSLRPGRFPLRDRRARPPRYRIATD